MSVSVCVCELASLFCVCFGENDHIGKVRAVVLRWSVFLCVDVVVVLGVWHERIFLIGGSSPVLIQK